MTAITSGVLRLCCAYNMRLFQMKEIKVFNPHSYFTHYKKSPHTHMQYDYKFLTSFTTKQQEHRK